MGTVGKCLISHNCEHEIIGYRRAQPNNNLIVMLI
jgi:hypothetical protein